MHELAIDQGHAIRTACVISAAGLAVPSAAAPSPPTRRPCPRLSPTTAPTSAHDARARPAPASAGRGGRRASRADREPREGTWSPGAATIDGGGGTLGAPWLSSAISATSLTGARGGGPSPTASAQTLQFDLLPPAGTSSTISLSRPLRLASARRRERVRPALGARAGGRSVSRRGRHAARRGRDRQHARRARRSATRAGDAARRPRGLGAGGRRRQRLVVPARRRLTVSGHVSGARRVDTDDLALLPRHGGCPAARARAPRPPRALPPQLAPAAARDVGSVRDVRRSCGALETSRSPCGAPRVLVTG